MKKIIISCFVIMSLIITTNNLNAQPDPPADPESGGGPVGGAAPIDGGLGILLAFGTAYAFKRYYSSNNSLTIEDTED